MDELTKRYIIGESAAVRVALERLNQLAPDGILFLVDQDDCLIGSMTDGDIRRSFIRGLSFEDPIREFSSSSTRYVLASKMSFLELLDLRSEGYLVIPVIDDEGKIADIINFNTNRSYLRLDVAIMAGGEGKRLLPLTLNCPKPLLPLGDKPIIEHSIDRLALFGVKNFSIAIKYLGDQIIDHFGDGSSKDLSISYYTEEKPLGTIGAIAMMPEFSSDYILVTYSDILTDIDYEEMYKFLLEKNGDMVVATTTYEVQVPYGVIETEGDKIVNLEEKPTYLYYANAGIYIIKKEHIDLIPKGDYFDATDLMEKLYDSGKVVLNFPIRGYWLDIGKHNDFEKAKKDIKYLRF